MLLMPTKIKVSKKDVHNFGYVNTNYTIASYQLRYLSVYHNPLAPSVSHGRGPRPRFLSPWALGTCAPILPPPASTGSLRKVQLQGNEVDPSVGRELC